MLDSIYDPNKKAAIVAVYDGFQVLGVHSKL